MSQPECLETCPIWPVVENELESKHAELTQKLYQAKGEEFLRQQQHHESDGEYIPTGRVDEVENQIEMEASLLETERIELQTRADGCTGSPCALAEYCVRTTIAKDLTNLL